MDFESLCQYENKSVKLTLNNNFWYKAKIISIKEDSVHFIEMKGKNITVHPSAIMMIEEVGNGY